MQAQRGKGGRNQPNEELKERDWNKEGVYRSIAEVKGTKKAMLKHAGASHYEMLISFLDL